MLGKISDKGPPNVHQFACKSETEKCMCFISFTSATISEINLLHICGDL